MAGTVFGRKEKGLARPLEACADARPPLSGLRGLRLCGDRPRLVDMPRAVTDDPLGYVTFKLTWRAVSLLGMHSDPSRAAEQWGPPQQRQLPSSEPLLGPSPSY